MADRDNAFYDNHTLFIKCGTASAAQIRAAFLESLKEVQSKMGGNVDCRFRVNIIETNEGSSFGVAFVFVSNPAVYHMLLGKNPDGSDRVEYHDDPSWVAPSAGETTNAAGWCSIPEPVISSSSSWFDACEEEEEYEELVRAQAQRFICPKIPVHLEPLMTLPSYELTPQQIEAKRMAIISANEGKEGFDPELIKIPSHAHIGIDRAKVDELPDKFMPNILKCTNVPPWITERDLKSYFAPYASDSSSLQERYIKGRRFEETYPFVNMNNQRVAFIIFDSSTRDAQFALHMMKKFRLPTKNPDEASVLLFFSHSYRNDRDLMADISQQPRPVNRNADRPGQNNRSAQPSRGASNNRSGQNGRGTRAGPNDRTVPSRAAPSRAARSSDTTGSEFSNPSRGSKSRRPPLAKRVDALKITNAFSVLE